MNTSDALDLHRTSRGKIAVQTKVPLETAADLARAYTPGVGAVSSAIADDPEEVWQLTNRANQVAIVSDGTAVLGLGDIGPQAALPVMEGKSAIMKTYADIDAFPLCINADSADEIVQFCKQIEPTFAAINLEDIAAPRCFEVLERLQKELSIPVFHDDQDGTAIAVLAGLINALGVVGKDAADVKIVINGAGAAGIAIARLLHAYGVGSLTMLDSKGVINAKRDDLNAAKKQVLPMLAQSTSGDLAKSVALTDVFIGVSKAGVLTEDMVASMNEHAIVFALANPTPEIMPDSAHRAGAVIVATGRSDFDNQINNALVFPGLFKGLLSTPDAMLDAKLFIRIATALSALVDMPSKTHIIPQMTDARVVDCVATAVKEAI